MLRPSAPGTANCAPARGHHAIMMMHWWQCRSGARRTANGRAVMPQPERLSSPAVPSRFGPLAACGRNCTGGSSSCQPLRLVGSAVRASETRKFDCHCQWQRCESLCGRRGELHSESVRLPVYLPVVGALWRCAGRGRQCHWQWVPRRRPLNTGTPSDSVWLAAPPGPSRLGPSR